MLETVSSHLKPYLEENISLQNSNCSILELAVTVTFFTNEARFTQIQVFFRASSVQNEDGDPPIFVEIFEIIGSSSFNAKILRKKKINVRKFLRERP